MNLNEFTAHQIHDLLVRKEIRAVEVTEAALRRIDEVEEKVNAYVTVRREEVLREAEEIDRKIHRGEMGSPLMGIPIAIKDNICARGVKTTCSSKILYNFQPPYDADVVDKLRKVGAILIGKTNMDEFAMGSSTENSAFGATHNPWNLGAVPGGSSGGSAAAVAAGESILALGSDTGGSIRQPAGFCAVVGMKPTYGLVSRYGLVAFASSLDQIGPMARDVRDTAILMNLICGHDPKDSTSLNVPVPDYTRALVNDIKGLKIGIPKEYFGEGIELEVREAIDKSIEVLKKLGASIKETSLPHTEYAVAIYYLIATAEASSNLARYDGVQYGYRAKSEKRKMKKAMVEMYENTRREGFGDEVKRRIMLGTYGLSAGYYHAYYLKAEKVRTLIGEDFDKAFKDFHCLLTPTSPTPPFRIGEKIDDPLKMYLSDIFTISANLAGLPAISIPCGFTKDGLPIGMQLMAKPLDEETLLRVAYTFEQNTDYHLKKCKV
ncbi:Asp-tRNA(Asn)/Glu-tRNA(Gln) amidotransferase subunit GatA [candidate division NPL-UPA2 bacterium]|nr:Asp-tRNA(Asn)/Glu-tRNA(Gln) amidotransferase subunit GatA [candidate division NPL-UPA2 bacterium]